MTHDVKLGGGMGTGMFFHAPKGTALPVYPTEELGEAWKEVGYVAEDGFTWATGRSAEPLKDWAGKIRRMLQSDTDRNVSVPIISTTKEVLETIFGANNVVSTAANADHGNLLSLEVKEGTMSDEEAFLLLMKDGDDTMMLGCTSGFLTTLDDISFVGNTPVTWNVTISSDCWKHILDDGQVVTTP